ncbi:MAG: hypothetical protein LAT55_12820 [Opitutales bacterium]|nr:hypothetical protein [Opitutales bacterium]
MIFPQSQPLWQLATNRSVTASAVGRLGSLKENAAPSRPSPEASEGMLLHPGKSTAPPDLVSPDSAPLFYGGLLSRTIRIMPNIAREPVGIRIRLRPSGYAVTGSSLARGDF